MRWLLAQLEIEDIAEVYRVMAGYVRMARHARLRSRERRLLRPLLPQRIWVVEPWAMAAPARVVGVE